MNIIKREIKANFKSLIFWSLGLALLVFLWMIEFQSLANNPLINDFMESIPEGLMKIMGMAELNISSLEGFVGTILLYLYLIMGIHAVLLGTSIIAKEERDRTAEYLYSMPISRKRVMGEKIIASFINISILNLVGLGAMLVSSSGYQRGEDFYRIILLIFLALFIFQLIFLSLGILLASLNSNYKKTGNRGVSILMLAFILSSIINLVDKLNFLKFMTPFKYFDAKYIIKNQNLSGAYMLISAIIIITSISVSFIFYPRRDLNIK